MKKKSIWFYSNDKKITQAVFLIAPGLNLLPEKMQPITHFLTSKNCDVLQMALADNPDHWEESFNKDYEAACEHSEILQRPLYFIGYSLGALLALTFISKNPNHHIKKMALIAPAIYTKRLIRLPALLATVFPKLKLMSLNHIDYRIHKSTPLYAYKKLHQLQKSIQKILFSIPALIIINQFDEVLSLKKIKHFVDQNPKWTLMPINEKVSQLSPKFHHLIIDEKSLGHFMWQKVIQNLTEYFEL